MSQTAILGAAACELVDRDAVQLGRGETPEEFLGVGSFLRIVAEVALPLTAAMLALAIGGGSAAFVTSHELKAQTALNPPTLRVRAEVDGKVVVDLDEEVLMVAIGNGASVGGGLELTPDADPHDGQVDVLVATTIIESKHHDMIYRAGASPEFAYFPLGAVMTSLDLTYSRVV